LPTPTIRKFKPPKTAGTAELLLKEMDASGVSHCVLVQVIYHGWDNRYVAHCLKAHPKRFRGQGLIEPDRPQGCPEAGVLGEEARACPACASARSTTRARMTGSMPGEQRAVEKAGELKAIFKLLHRHPANCRSSRTWSAASRRCGWVIDHLARVDLKAADPLPEFKKLLGAGEVSRGVGQGVRTGRHLALGKYPFRDTFPWVKRLYEAFGPTAYCGGRASRA